MEITNGRYFLTLTIITIMAVPVLIIKSSMNKNQSNKTQEEIRKTHEAENKNIAVKNSFLMERLRNLKSTTTKKPTTKGLGKLCVLARCL